MPGPHDFVPLAFERLAAPEQAERLRSFLAGLESGRSREAALREPVDSEVVREAVRVAGTGPSGANLQPWHYLLVTNPDMRRALRQAAAQEGEGPWELLEQAGALVILFRVNHSVLPGGRRLKHYYVHESAGISAGFLLGALWQAGVAAVILPPVAAAGRLLRRPQNESPFLTIAVGGGQGADARGAVERYYEMMRTRRVIREFSPEPVPEALLSEILSAAERAPLPGGLPVFRLERVSDLAVKRELRRLAEQEERLFYESRITPEWREALAPLGTDWEKPFVEVAPHLAVCFKVDPPAPPAGSPDGFLRGGRLRGGLEFASIAAGLLIQAIHLAGLACLTHTPSPMNFLRDALGRPKSETPFLLLPIGYPAPGCRVPNIARKPLEQILTIL